MRFAALSAAFLVLAPLAARAEPPSHIGSWIVACPAGHPCVMRFSKPLADGAGVSSDLEVRTQVGLLVPVITLHGVPSDLLAAAAMAGSATVTVRFPSTAPADLACFPTAEGGLCAPGDADARRLAASLPTAHGVSLRLSIIVQGAKPMPDQQRTLTLTGTADALARFRATRMASVPGPDLDLAEQSPLTLMATADRWLKAAGYKNGIAGVQTLFDSMRSK